MKNHRKSAAVSVYIGAHIDDVIIGAFSHLTNDPNRRIILNTTNNIPHPESYPAAYTDIPYNQYGDALHKEITQLQTLLDLDSIISLAIPDGESFFHIGSIRSNCNRLLEEIQPDTIYFPTYQGSHIDHEVVSAIVPSLSYVHDRSPHLFEYGLYHKCDNAYIHNKIPDHPEAFKTLDPATLQQKQQALLTLRTKKADVKYFIDNPGESIRPFIPRDVSKKPVDSLLYEETHGITFDTFYQQIGAHL